MNDSTNNLVHWADMTADRIIRQCGDKEEYTLASGITPSGTVHFGNFREVITVEFVARALRSRGKKVRFIFSWDDYDTFRKIPKNMPKQEELQKYMYQPIVDTPDPFEKDASYAAHHEKAFEAQLAKVGISPTPLYQATKYRAGEYKNLIKLALKKREDIIAILSQYKTEPMDADWCPVLVYCSKCNRDRVKDMKYDGDSTLSYKCELCGHEGKEDLNTTSRVKLPWRVDWPMRWSHEKVDFEPGGKDHSSQGGSYTTAKEIVAKVFDWRPPVYLQYDFVSIKGAGGKMSSSSGEVITVNDILDVYEPEMVRWIFASYKTNIDFAISFDLDVIKMYEDFDRQERQAFGLEKGNDKTLAMARRVYELSQIHETPKECPIQPSFRHLCNILQINDGNIASAREWYQDDIKTPRDERRFKERSERAWFWINNYAPDDFKFMINKSAPKFDMEEQQKLLVKELISLFENEWASFTEDQILHDKIYEVINKIAIDPQTAFKTVYQLLISRDKGPKLAGFIRIIGKERVLDLLKGI